MKLTKDIYLSSLSLFTDLYQLTMAYGYWKANKTDQEAVFHLYFRKNPFQGGYTISCGLDYVIDYLENLKFTDSDIAYLQKLKGNDDKPLFDQGFLDYLKEMDFCCDIDAIPEGNVVFPNEPLIRIKGPLFQCQIIETPLLNMINFQSLIATKASRLRIAAKDDIILEFGTRRAQGVDGALAASRAAYIGGCSATSNILAGKIFDIPVKGTHAHSWVMSFDNELEAFHNYAKAMPNNCVFLVDTYNTIRGVENAIKVGKELRKEGFEMAGIRLDSGDLAYLSIKARRLLDNAGFENASIVASNDLDENIITSLKVQQDAKVNVWGVGTKLATAYDQPALGGVYKIGALKNENGNWDYKIKLSEQVIKTSIPGIQQVRRFYLGSESIGDMIYNEGEKLPEGQQTLVDPKDGTRRKYITKETYHKDLLVPIFEKGKRVYESPDIHSIRKSVEDELSTIDKSIKRFSNPHSYPVGLEARLYELRTNLILELRKS